MSSLAPTQTKIEPTMSVLYPTQTFRGLEREGWARQNRRTKKPATSKGDGFNRVGLGDLESHA